MQDNRKVRVIFEAVLNKFTNNVKTAAKATLEIGDAGEKASKRANFDDSAKSADNLDNSLKKVTQTLKAMAIGYAGKKLFDAGKENFMFFADYQKKLTETFTLLPDITQEGMDRMSEDVKQFSKDMKVMPEEVLPALYQAISASVPESKVFDFLEVARKSAVGGVTETSTAVDVLTSVVNAYGDDVISANKASDLMFMAMRKGKTTFEEMASNMYSVLPAAKSLEVPFENITAAIATMTAMGTPTAQSTTQLGRMFLEFSKDGTKASEIFLQATNKTFKQFIAEGNNLQDALNIMDAVAKKAGVEINNLFNTAEAGNAALALTGKGAIRFSEDLKAMEESTGSTEKAYEKMSGTISFFLEGIRAKIAVFKLNIADKYFPEIQDAIMKVDESFDRLEENGSLDRLAESIGGIIATVILEFDKWLNNIDFIIERLEDMASFIQYNLPGAIGVIKLLVKAFAVMKIISFINSIKAAIGVVKSFTAVQWALNAAMNANPIGIIITLVGLLILWIIKLTDGFTNFENLGMKALTSVKLLFLHLVEKIMWGVNIVLTALSLLLGNIPLIGTAFKSTARVTGSALSNIRDEINSTMVKMDELNNKKIAPKIEYDEIDPKWYVDDAGIPPGLAQRYGIRSETPTKVDGYSLDKISSIGDSDSIGASKPKTTIHDRIRAIEDRYSPDIDLYESREKLAEFNDDSEGVRSNRRSIIDILKKQASDLFNLQKSSKGQDIKIVETARNKLLLKIEELLSDINEGVSKIVGDFNLPSELKALTEYQYKVEKADNKLSKRLVYSPNIEMYLTIADTAKKGIAQVRQEIEGFTSAIFDDKNDLVTKFMQDVTRN